MPKDYQLIYAQLKRKWEAWFRNHTDNRSIKKSLQSLGEQAGPCVDMHPANVKSITGLCIRNKAFAASLMMIGEKSYTRILSDTDE